MNGRQRLAPVFSLLCRNATAYWSQSDLLKTELVLDGLPQGVCSEAEEGCNLLARSALSKSLEGIDQPVSARDLVPSVADSNLYCDLGGAC